MGITCAYHQNNDNKQPEVTSESDEELDILTPRPLAKKDVVFIWNLDIFLKLMTTSLEKEKEKDILQEQVDELVLDLAERHFYYKDLQEYKIVNIYENPLVDTGQNIRTSTFSDDTNKPGDFSENMSIEDKKIYNKLTSLCRRVKESYCQNCKKHIDELISREKEHLWSNVKRKMESFKDKWLSEAVRSLQIINSRSSCVNILLTSSHLMQALSRVLLFELGDVFRIENIYSTANIGKEKCFRKISQQFGENSNVFVFGVNKEDEKLAEKLKMAFWKVSDQEDVDSLHHALKHNYL